MKKVERHHTKGKVWSGRNILWTIQAVKNMSTFDFATVYTKLPYSKLLYVLNKTTDFGFTIGIRDYGTVYSSGTF